VARRISDDKGAFRRSKKSVGDIDRYALLPLVLQSVQQQRKIDVVPGCAEPPRVPLQCRQPRPSAQCSILLAELL
jgi:hypothetical protein